MQRARTAVVTTTDGRTVANDVRIADTFWTRAVGLLGRKEMKAGEGLLFVPGGTVHTIGMRITIDVAFLDREYRVLKTRQALAPYSASAAPRGTHYTLELSSRRLEQVGVRAGDQLKVSPSK